MTAGRGLSGRAADGGTPAALIVILAPPCTEPTAPTEALPIGVASHMAAGDTFADRPSARRPLINRYVGPQNAPHIIRTLVLIASPATMSGHGHLDDTQVLQADQYRGT
jgi:hypothetical protein